MDRDLKHSSPHVRLLAQWSDEDDIIEMMTTVACREHGVRTLTDLFALDPALVVEIHDQAAILLDELAPESDDLSELGLMADPDVEADAEAYDWWKLQQ